jgi:nucleotide-binding universal stress UspA family protein
MRKFLVPTDFSDTAKNAGRFAAQMLAGKNVEIVLYHVYEKIAAGSDGTPLTEDDEDRQIIYSNALGNVKADLLAISPSLNISVAAEEGKDLIENIGRFVRHNGIDMVIMGITGATRLEQIFMGSNTLKLAKEAVAPVMIIPPDAKYIEIRDVMITSDFKDVESTTPVAPIRKVLDLFKPKLHIVNVDTEHYVELTEDYKIERAKLEKFFSAYNPQFSFMRLYDFQEAVNAFTEDYEIDLIITIPKKHSFLGGLFKSSNTKKMAYHSHVPVVAIHE